VVVPPCHHHPTLTAAAAGWRRRWKKQQPHGQPAATGCLCSFLFWLGSSSGAAEQRHLAPPTALLFFIPHCPHCAAFFYSPLGCFFLLRTSSECSSPPPPLPQPAPQQGSARRPPQQQKRSIPASGSHRPSWLSDYQVCFLRFASVLLPSSRIKCVGADRKAVTASLPPQVADCNRQHYSSTVRAPKQSCTVAPRRCAERSS
jgi:hypothetical protein